MGRLLRMGLDGPLVRNSHEQVVELLGAAIVRGEPPPDATLPRDEELEERFGVSRTVLREAVKTLSAKGLLVARSRVGTRVRPRDDWDMLDSDVLRWHLDAGTDAAFFEQLSEMRLAVEPAAAALAAARATDEAVAGLRLCLERMRVAPDRRSFAVADFDLHRLVIHASGNVFMSSVGTVIEAVLLTSFWISSPADDPEVQEAVTQAHGRIVEGIAARDPEAAQDAMRAVIRFGQDRIAESAGPT